jgi:feruloyl esterase
MNRGVTLLTAAAAVGSCIGYAANAQAASCESLASLKLANTRIDRAETVAAGSFKPPSAPPGAPAIYATLPAFCRAAGAITPTSDSDIQFEVWMPAQDWNGRFQGVGNGGLAGSISYAAMADALANGYATASTDTGHKGTFDVGQWAMGHPEKVIDFGHRAVHEMTVQSKAVVAAFYGDKPRYSYWNGCSEGGAQALSEAQRYPQDYDGILAGAPANFITGLQTGGLWVAHALHKDPATFVPAAKMQFVSRAVLDACDAKDGVTDGVLENPRSCRVDLQKLACKAGDSAECLTAKQIEGLEKVYAGARNPRTKELLFPGAMPGGEMEWQRWVVGDATPPNNGQHGIADAFYRYFVFEDANWQWQNFDFDKDVARAEKKLGVNLNHTSTDLSAFKARGGKLLQYHGWSDAGISPLNSIAYYESVQKKMGDTRDFYRLFMMPGMGHCRGGPGPSDFDKMGVIVKWVESGQAPDSIVATHSTQGKVDRSRPLCPYGQVAKWRGSGSTDQAESFVCARPEG